MHKLPFVKTENLRFAKKTLLFLRVLKLDIVLVDQYGSKNQVGKVCSPKIFFNFSSPVKGRNFRMFKISS